VPKIFERCYIKGDFYKIHSKILFILNKKNDGEKNVKKKI
jgi:hypothetical protein